MRLIAVAVALAAAACAPLPEGAVVVGATPPTDRAPLSTVQATHLRATGSPDAPNWVEHVSGDPAISFETPASWYRVDLPAGQLMVIDPEGAQIEVFTVVREREVGLDQESLRWRAAADTYAMIAKPYRQRPVTLPTGAASLFEYDAHWTDGTWGPEQLYLFVRGRSFYSMRFACRRERVQLCEPIFSAVRSSLRWLT